jgi:hypothetical protein
MKIDRILSGLRESQNPSEKTAAAAITVAATPAAKPEEKTASTNSLVSAMNAAVAAAPSTQKTASEAPKAGPVEDVMKIAEDLASAEKEAMVKQAQVMGAAFADAVVARLGKDWTKAAAAQPAAPAPTPAVEKVATGDVEFDKWASENPEAIEQAKAGGYPLNRVGLEKMAEDSYVQGYNNTVVAIHKTAALEFLKGAAVCANVIEASRQAQAAQQ